MPSGHSHGACPRCRPSMWPCPARESSVPSRAFSSGKAHGHRAASDRSRSRSHDRLGWPAIAVAGRRPDQLRLRNAARLLVGPARAHWHRHPCAARDTRADTGTGSGSVCGLAKRIRPDDRGRPWSQRSYRVCPSLEAQGESGSADPAGRRHRLHGDDGLCDRPPSSLRDSRERTTDQSAHLSDGRPPDSHITVRGCSAREYGRG
jgi:hypothetical protein